MSYVVINQFVYSNALAGAVAGMGINQGNPTNPNPSFYLGMVQVAETFAQSFDTRWNAISLFAADEFNVQAILATCKSYWSNRNAAVAVGTPGEFTTQTNFDSISNALIAMINEAESLYPPPGPPPIATASGNDFVFRPGDPLGNHANVYVTAAALATAVQAVQGPKRIQVDATLAPAHFTTGVAFNMDECTFFSSIGGGATVLHFDTGFGPASFGIMTLENIEFQQNSAAAPAVTMNAGSMLILRSGSNIQSTTAQPWGNQGGGGEAATTVILTEASSLGEGTNPVLNGGSQINIFAMGTSFIASNSLVGAVNVDKSEDSTIQFPQTGGLTFGQSATPTFIYQPGGGQGPNTYNTWAGLMAAVAAWPGEKSIVIDGTITAATVPAGLWNIDQCTFYNNFGVGAAGRTLTFLQGATIQFASFIKLASNTQFRNSSTNPVMTISDNLLRFVQIDGALMETNAGAGPFFNVTGAATGGVVIQLVNQGVAGNNARPIITQAGGLAGFDVLSGSTLQASAFTSSAGTFVFTRGADGIIQSPQALQWVEAYAPHQLTSTATAGSGGAIVTVGPTLNFTRTKSGVVLVSVTASVVASSQCTVTGALNGSVSGTIANGNQSISAATVAAGGALLFTYTAPDVTTAAGQTWSLTLTASAGTLTVVGNPILSVTEFGS